MMCIRGGSPPPLNGSPMQTSGGTRLAQQLQHDEQYFSGDSYSSYDSYEERRRRRSKERRGTVAGNQRKGGRDGGNKRRRLNKDDSEVSFCISSEYIYIFGSTFQLLNSFYRFPFTRWRLIVGRS